jgi:hypothetical protein
MYQILQRRVHSAESLLQILVRGFNKVALYDFEGSSYEKGQGIIHKVTKHSRKPFGVKPPCILRVKRLQAKM